MGKNRILFDLVIDRLPGASSGDKIKLCEKFDREADLFVLSKEDIDDFLGKRLKSWNLEGLLSQAEKDERFLTRNGIHGVSYAEEDYPPLLRELFDPPAFIYYQGSLPAGEKPLAAVVGTRKPSGAGAAAAFDFGRAFGRRGIPVVSGLALGIDALSHRGNLEGGAPTVAVLGSALDRVYPVSNRPLARRILESGGALLSEYPPGTGPNKWNFPARNRIIAALSRGTLIVEAPSKSGALITADFALELGRDLWVSRVGVESRLGEGTRRLAGEGAPVITGIEDILEDWGLGSQPGSEGSPNLRFAVPPLQGLQGGDTIPLTGTALAESLARSLNITSGLEGRSEDKYGC
ncbi:MAG: DNA-processing protein DprA [Treponema sp.]|jgi:DNA processing protein|nr:DNA-processing protein DprA [Treponema sp.]